MTKLKKTLAVLLAMALLCGFAALGVSAANATQPALTEAQVMEMIMELLPASPTNAQLAEMRRYLPTIISIAIVESFLQRVPRWLNWAVFTNGSSFVAMQAELIKELDKTGISFDDYTEWLLSGEIMNRWQESLTYGKALAEKGPGIMKNHTAFYIGWWLDSMLWFNRLAGRLPLFA